MLVFDAGLPVFDGQQANHQSVSWPVETFDPNDVFDKWGWEHHFWKKCVCVAARAAAGCMVNGYRRSVESRSPIRHNAPGPPACREAFSFPRLGIARSQRNDANASELGLQPAI